MDNYRGITVVSIFRKIYTTILLKRISGYAESVLGNEQHGFRKGRGANELILVLRHKIRTHAQRHRNGNPFKYIAFVDFQKAFNSVRREAIRGSLCELGFPNKIVSVIMSLYEGLSAVVSIFQKGATGDFEINKGVALGCILSRTLFNLVMEILRRRLKETFPNVAFYLYADDLAIISKSEDELTKAVICLNILRQKTKLMAIGVKGEQFQREHEYEIVEEFEYLGGILMSSGSDLDDAKERIANAKRAMKSI